ncbi:MAG: P-loop NTPase [Anaerolineae bacterium]|nr:P-loop NTPase [Anaerolineae bacterium]
MDLKLYLDILKRRVFVIVITTVVATLVVVAADFLLPPIYTAQATVRILLDVGVADFILREDYNTRLLNTYAHVLTSRSTLEEAIRRVAPDDLLTVSELSENVEVIVVPDTELLTISVQNGSRFVARELANELSVLLMEYAKDLYVGDSTSTLQILEDQLVSLENQLAEDRQQLAVLMGDHPDDPDAETLRSQIQFYEDAYDRLLDRYELARLNESLRANSVTVISPAALPTHPSNRLGVMQIGLGGVIGLFCGVGLALVLENVDARIHSPHQLETLVNLPVLGLVPRGMLAVGTLGEGGGPTKYKPINEAYRLLSINLLALQRSALQGEGAPIQTILVTSAVPSEGKSMVAANLAQAFAERGQTVFLVEGDLRRPSLAKMLDIESSVGLGDLLASHTPFDRLLFGQAIHPTEQSTLFVISSSDAKSFANPTLLLASPSMGKIVDYLGTQGQITLLDAPPVLGMADVSVLAPQVDGVVLVVRQAFSNRDHLREALKQLQAVQARVLGVIFVDKSQKGWNYR